MKLGVDNHGIIGTPYSVCMCVYCVVTVVLCVLHIMLVYTVNVIMPVHLGGGVWEKDHLFRDRNKMDACTE